MLFLRGGYLMLQLNDWDNGFIRVYWAGLSQIRGISWRLLTKQSLDKLKRLKVSERAGALLGGVSYANVRLISERETTVYSEGNLGNIRAQWHRCAAQCRFSLQLFVGPTSHHHLVSGKELGYRFAISTRCLLWRAVCTHVPWLRKQPLWFQ